MEFELNPYMQSQFRGPDNRSRIQTVLQFGAPAVIVLAIVTWAHGHEAGPSPLNPVEPFADMVFLQKYREPFVPWAQPVESESVGICLNASRALWSAGA